MLTSPHLVSVNYTLTHIISTKIATVYFYNKNIAVVEINEGVTLSYLSGAKLLLKGLLYLKGRPWVYISNRVNSYSVVPTDYGHLDRINSLKALSIVTNNQGKKYTPHIESIFCKKPLEITDSLEEAMNWASEQLKSYYLKK